MYEYKRIIISHPNFDNVMQEINLFAKQEYELVSIQDYYNNYGEAYKCVVILKKLK